MAKEKKRGKKKRELFNFNNAIILLVILLLFAILKTIFVPPELKEVKTDLAEEAEIMLGKLTNSNEAVSLLRSNELIEEKIENLDQMDYEEVKKILGVKNDFCIFFEDISGNIVKVNDITLGIGSDEIYVNGDPCE